MSSAGGDDIDSAYDIDGVGDVRDVSEFGDTAAHDPAHGPALDPLSEEIRPAVRVLRLGRSHVSGAVAGLITVAAITSGLLTVGPTDTAPPSTAPAVSTSAPTTTASTATATATGVAGLPGMPGLDVVTAARMVSEALAASPLSTPTPTASRVVAVPVSNVVPTRMLDAYRRGEKVAAARYPRCNLPWWLLAGIGRVESGHAAGGAVDASGVTVSRILGPRLDGTTPGTAVIRDTDAGRIDGDVLYDRAVGPMQFIPGTWVGAGIDGNGDGVADPHQVDDAAASAAGYLCSAGGDMRRPSDMAAAILRYNNSQQYVEDVLAGAVAYRDGVVPVAAPRRIDGTPERAPATTRGTASGGAPKPTTSRGGAPSGASKPTTSTMTAGRAPVTTPTGAAPGSVPATTPSATTGALSGTATPAQTPAATHTSAPPTHTGPTHTAPPTPALPTCRPAPVLDPTGTPTPPTAVPTPTASPTGPSPTHTWEPDDPRIAHLPVCEEPQTAAATPAEPSTATSTD